MYLPVLSKPFKKSILCALICSLGYVHLNAQYATSGTGLYKNLIYWLNWDLNSNGLGDDVITNNTIRTFNLGNGIVLTGTISNYSGSPVIRSYSTGNWMGDKLDDLYGGVNPIGIANLGNVVTYTISLAATKNGQSFSLPGMVVAEAEDLLGTNEYDQFTTAGSDWRLIDKFMPNFVEATYSNNNKTIRLNRPASTGSSNAGTGVYYTDASVIDLSTGQGQSMAYGIIVPIEYSDAPATYGAPLHFSLTPAISGGTNPGTPVNVVGLSGMALGTIDFSNPSVLLGSSCTISSGPSPSVNANGKVEDAFSSGVRLYPGRNFQTLSVPVKNTSGGAATLYSWIDADQDGIFEAAEIATAVVPDGATSATLNWSSFPLLTAGSSYYVRFRITSESLTDDGSTAVDERSTVAAINGEVEDYLSVQITLPMQWGKLDAWRDGKLIQVKWNTLQERQLSHFALERSNDGSNWSVVLKNIPASNAADGRTYQQADPSYSTGKLFYRVKQIDIDGQYSYSSIVIVEAEKKLKTMSLYPNPVTSEFYLKNSSSAISSVEIYASSGSRVRKWNSAKTSYPLSGLVEGIYTIRVILENGDSQTFKISKTKTP